MSWGKRQEGGVYPCQVLLGREARKKEQNEVKPEDKKRKRRCRKKGAEKKMRLGTTNPSRDCTFITYTQAYFLVLLLYACVLQVTDDSIRK